MSGSNYNLGLSFSNDFIKGDTIYRFTTAMTFQPAHLNVNLIYLMKQDFMI